jgi:ubiquinone/menaquinone biosynthesis C-methylase UbiE
MTSSFAYDSPELAATYDRVSTWQLESGKRLVERLGIAAGARVLDIGCGTGRLAAWIGERVGPTGHVTGIDPLEERVRLAREHVPAARFEVGQAEELGAFGDASFDFVCLSSVFHWIGDKPKALAEVRRVLVPGGRVGVTTFPNELRDSGTVARVLMPLFGREPYASRIDLSTLPFARDGKTTTDHIGLVLAAGLELAELHVMPRDRIHASGAAFVDFMDASSFGNFLWLVPDELRARFRTDLAAELESLRGPDGVVDRSWGLAFVAARA